MQPELTMTADNARKRAREIYRDADPSAVDYTIRTMILRKLIREGCDPLIAATAAGFQVNMVAPAWLADLVRDNTKDQ